MLTRAVKRKRKITTNLTALQDSLVSVLDLHGYQQGGNVPIEIFIVQK